MAFFINWFPFSQLKGIKALSTKLPSCFGQNLPLNQICRFVGFLQLCREPKFIDFVPWNENLCLLLSTTVPFMSCFVFRSLGHDNAVNSSQISHDNSWLLTASDDKTAKLWNTSHSNALLTFSNIKHNFNAEKVTSKSEQVLQSLCSMYSQFSNFY